MGTEPLADLRTEDRHARALKDPLLPAFMEAGFFARIDDGYLAVECIHHSRAFVITPTTSAAHVRSILTHECCAGPHDTARVSKFRR